MDEIARILIFTIIFTLSAAILLLFFFSISRRRQLQHKKQLLEQEFRTREDALLQISRDLHDDIGSSLSGINMLSQLAQQQLTQVNTGAANELLQKINNYTSEVIEKVSDMAWLLKPNAESLSLLIKKIKAFGLTATASKNIQLHFDDSIEMGANELSIQQRKAIYLISKEAINNAAKYAECANIYYKISLADNTTKLLIKDDGKGFNLTETGEGNGLKNMQARAAEIKAVITINSAQGKGTTIEMEL
jgi:two-component system, NarL family, sensor histidine kinase UhpB